MKKKPVIIVHGGAWDIPDDLVKAHKSGCKKAAVVGYAVLRQGGSALDAVVEAVKVMEDDPTFDAGVGSFLNARGKVELDAAIMDGKSLNCGVVGAVTRLKNPIVVARLVMEKTDNVMLVGRGAMRLAQAHGLPMVRLKELLTERELMRWQQLKCKKNFSARQIFANGYRDTVGAVAFDQWGNLAAANSTGGTPNKLPGRVGDTGQIGSGIYADNTKGAVCSTGWGEPIIKIVMAKSICDRMAQESSVTNAIRDGLGELKKRANGFGGAIAINRYGNIGFGFNTPRMAYAFAESKSKVVVGI